MLIGCQDQSCWNITISPCEFCRFCKSFKRVIDSVFIVKWSTYFFQYNIHLCSTTLKINIIDTLTAQIPLTLSCHPNPFNHFFWQVLETASSVSTELININFCWYVHESLLDHIAYEFVYTSPAVPSLFCWSYLNGLWNGR